MPTRKTKTNQREQENAEKEMTLSGHLRELRNRVFVCLVLLLVAIVVILNYASDLVQLLLNIGTQYGYSYIYISPQELLIQYFSLSLILGVCVTLPMIFYQIWAFIRPGLKKNENVFFLLAMVFGLICFCIGVYFAYRIMLPFMLHFLISLSTDSGVTASISVQNYITFLMTIFLIFGIVFELPVVSVLLTQMGLLKPEWMKKGTRVVIVVIFVVAALITPPDIVSQVMVAIPMIGLYELSILLCTICQKLRGTKATEEPEEE
jgi:sec-independent protein translocase protein TatC